MGRSRRTLRAGVVAVGFSMVAMSTGPGGGGAPVVQAQAGPGRPNIVVVMVDDLDSRAFARLLSLGLLPNIQTSVVNRGVSFANSFVTNSLCCPSRATFLTGQYSHNNGVLSNAPPNGGVAALDDTSTLATWLRAAGYRTSFVGKYLNYYGVSDINRDGTIDMQDVRYVPPGWDDWQALVDPSTYLMYQYTINDNTNLVTYGTAAADYQTDVLAERAARAIDAAEANDAQPFFLTIFPSAPHSELWPAIAADTFADVWRWTIRPAPRHLGTITVGVPPVPSFNEVDVSDKPAWLQVRAPLAPVDMVYAQRKYQDRLASVRAIDDMVGRVVQALTQGDELQNTVIVFTSDNGFFIGEHRMSEKLAAYEESIRVPLVISMPTATGPQASSALVLNNDLAPTIAELAGATPGLPVDGRSLLPVIANPALTSWRRRFLVEHWAVDVTPMGVHDIPDFAAIRTGPLTYVEYDDGPQSREFYDTSVDPYQMKSLHNDSSADRTSQRQILSQWLAALKTCGGGSCQTFEFWTPK
jgi:N-acetylglucosamine-6-sulfatase